MKKRIIIIIGVILVILIGLFIYTFIKYNNISKTSLSNIEDYQANLTNFLSKVDISNTGSIDLNANYKGAHGESYPSEYQYYYKYENKKLYLSDEYYVSIDLDLTFIDILKKLSTYDFNNYNSKSIGYNKITYKYDNGVLTINPSTKVMNLNIDDLDITIDDDKITIKVNDNTISITINDKGYYININDTLKSNIFMYDSLTTISVAVNSYIFYLEIGDTVKLNFNSQASIYNSIEIEINNGEDNTTLDNELLDYNENPITRYLSNIDISFWR